MLLKLIDLFTNLFYYGALSLEHRIPAGHHLGWWSVLIPVAGGLIIGLMARFGSERIRGHGIPEAMEAILIGKSRMQPKVAVLKPAVLGHLDRLGRAIRGGGTDHHDRRLAGLARRPGVPPDVGRAKDAAGRGGGGRHVGDFRHADGRRAAGRRAAALRMEAAKPDPRALASFVAALLRPMLLEAGPMFPVTTHAALPTSALIASALAGLLAGLLAMVLTAAVYTAEDVFHRLPIHWMWWPALGGLVVGVGGMIQPRALGVGYDIIDQLLRGDYVPSALVGLIVVKGVIWSMALGSGTSGGVLAPLLIMGVRWVR